MSMFDECSTDWGESREITRLDRNLFGNVKLQTAKNGVSKQGKKKSKTKVHKVDKKPTFENEDVNSAGSEKQKQQKKRPSSGEHENGQSANKKHKTAKQSKSDDNQDVKSSTLGLTKTQRRKLRRRRLDENKAIQRGLQASIKKDTKTAKKPEKKNPQNMRNKYKKLSLNGKEEELSPSNGKSYLNTVQPGDNNDKPLQPSTEPKQSLQQDHTKLMKKNLRVESSFNIRHQNPSKREPKKRKKASKETTIEDSATAEISQKSKKLKKKMSIKDQNQFNISPVSDKPEKKKRRKEAKLLTPTSESGTDSSSGILTSGKNEKKLSKKNNPLESKKKGTSKAKPAKPAFDTAKLKAALNQSVSSPEVASQTTVVGDRQTEEVHDKGEVQTKSLRERMQERLTSARFRYINEQLYKCTGEEAYNMMTEDPDAFQVYHQGFQKQVEKWPQNPINRVISYVSKRPRAVIADFGCGEAQLAKTVSNTVHSFDLVAANPHVTVCDMAKIPLDDGSVDIAVFCLALMGTNLADFLAEANRVLKKSGILLVAEVMSRFVKVGSFVRKVEKMGFESCSKDLSNTMFAWFEFTKTGKSPTPERYPAIELLPCLYKKR